MEPKDYYYRIPQRNDPFRPAFDARIDFVPELYNSHFLEFLTDRMRYNDPIAMDIETTGLKIGAKDFEIRMIQVGTTQRAWCIPAVDDNIELVYDALLRGNAPIITQGGVFDWTALMVKYGVAEIDPERLIDTKIMAHHWDTRTKDPFTKAPGHSLYALQTIHVHESVAEDIKKAPSRRARELGISLGEYFATVELDDEEYIKYAGLDVITTSLVRDSLQRNLSRSWAKGFHVEELFRTDHEDFYNCILMGARGMKIDVPYFRNLGEQYQQTYETCVKQAKDLGVEKIGSTVQLSAVFTAEGYEPLKRTPTGKYKVDAAELRRQADRGSKLATIVLEGKKAQKWNSTFVQGILEASSAHGRVHPKFDPLGARTGRYSSSEPNCQNIPGHVNDIRNGFVVDDPGTEVVVSLDYSGQESRLLAACSQDETLLADIAAGRKPPKLLTQRLYGDQHTEDQYAEIKAVYYAQTYGAGIRKLADMAGIPVEESKKIVTELFEMYPRAKEYSDEMTAFAAKNGYVRNLAGRLIVVDFTKPYSALNYILQGTGRELVASAIRKIMKSRWAKCLVLTVHDEIVLVCRKDEAEDMIREVSEMMDEEIRGVRFPAGAEICGPRWKGHYE